MRPAHPEHAARAYTARVEGRVQGVGFRYSARLEAERLGLVGWVRNSEAGDVELHFEGGPAACDAFLDWLRHGPPGAWVATLHAQEVAPTGRYEHFSIAF